MKTTLAATLVAGGLLAVLPRDTHAQRAAERAPNPNEAVTTCTASLIEVAEVASEENGLVDQINVKEGDLVTAYEKPPLRSAKDVEAGKNAPTGTPLVLLDTRLPLRQRTVAGKEYIKAREDATNDINQRYAEAAAKVAKAAWEKALDANRKVPGAISEIEVERLRLDYERAKLQIEQASHEQKLAVLTMDVKAEEYLAADDSIQRRKIYSPISGIVTNVYPHKGEWVKSGDPVFRVVNLDRVRVIGRLSIKDYDPADVIGKNVTVTILLRGGRQESFQGKVTFVDQELQAGDKYSVWAEVTNRKVGTNYLLLAGMKGDMRIDLSGTAAATARAGE